jgi:hypothetical protein
MDAMPEMEVGKQEFDFPNVDRAISYTWLLQLWLRQKILGGAASTRIPNDELGESLPQSHGRVTLFIL